MKKLLLIPCLFFCLFSFAQKIGLGEDSRDYTHFIIQLHPGNTIKDVTAQFPMLTVNRCLSKRMNIWLVERDTVSGAEAFLQQLKQNKVIQVAQFNHHIHSRNLVPNDADFPLQWDMQNTGQTVAGVAGTPGDDIDATDAWQVNHNNVTVNGDTIVVAVVDVGFDVTHDDLNFFVNHHEIPNNGIDDDGNGFIDDYLGWDVYDTAGDVNAVLGPDPHSMHCSGIAGAIGNNGIGIAGTCWGVQILRVCGSSDEEWQVVPAYDYLVTMRRLYNDTHGAKGAFIVSSNSSFGVDYGNPADYPLWCAMYDSMGEVGILSCAATTNNQVDVDLVGDMPTTCPSKWLISVTNTNNNDVIQAGTGKINIALGAPGTDIYSTELDNGYGYMTGTSMATPHVAGSIAAMYAAACPKLIDDYYARPDSLDLIIKYMLLSGVTPESSTNNQTSSGGVLNLYHAVLNVQEYNCTGCAYSLTDSITQPTCSNTCNGSILISTDAGQTFAYNQQNLCPGFYPITISDSSGCKQYQYVTLNSPDSIIINSITVNWPHGSSNGNIIVNASAGNYTLAYSLDGINYQATPTLVIDSVGNYTVYIKSETGCIVEEQVLATGVPEIAVVNDWSLYPNPANDVLNISVSVSQTSNVQFSIANILGETVSTQNQTVAAGRHIFSIPTASLPVGMYNLILQSGGTSAKKFIVAR